MPDRLVAFSARIPERLALRFWELGLVTIMGLALDAFLIKRHSGHHPKGGFRFLSTNIMGMGPGDTLIRLRVIGVVKEICPNPDEGLPKTVISNYHRLDSNI